MRKWLKQHGYTLACGIIALAIALACMGIFSGCGNRAHPATVLPPPSNPVGQTKYVEVQIFHDLRWAIGLSLAGMGVSIGVAIWLGSLIPRLAIVGWGSALGCGAVFLLAILTSVSLPWLPWIALALLLCVIVYVALHFRALVGAIQELHPKALSPAPAPLSDKTKRVLAKIKPLKAI